MQDPISGVSSRPRITARSIAVIGVMTGIAVALSFIPGFPIIPVVPFIRYEYSDIPIIIAALALGAPKGLLVAFLSVGLSLLFGAEGGGPWGALQHFIAIGVNAFAVALIYRFNRTRKGALIGLAVGVAARTLVMIPSNLLITPLYTGAPVEAVKELLLPGIIPVNFIKSLISAVVTFFLYKRVSKFLRGERA